MASIAALCAAPSVPMTPTKSIATATATAISHPHYTPRGLHTVPQPFHFSSSHHRSQAPSTPSLHPSHKENSAPLPASLPSAQPLKPRPTQSIPLPSTPSHVVASRTPQSLISHRQRMPIAAAASEAGVTGAVERVTAIGVGLEMPSESVVNVRVAEDAVSRRLDAEFSVDAASLAAIMAPPSAAPIAEFTTSDRQSILVSAVHHSCVLSHSPPLVRFSV